MDRALKRNGWGAAGPGPEEELATWAAWLDWGSDVAWPTGPAMMVSLPGPARGSMAVQAHDWKASASKGIGLLTVFSRGWSQFGSIYLELCRRHGRIRVD
jgi:hypothetical protein